MLRRRVSIGSGVLAAITLGAWAVAALGGQPITLVDGPAAKIILGDWSNLRLTALFVLVAVVAWPNDSQLEERLRGPLRFAFPVAFTAYVVAFKVTQHLAFKTGSCDLTMYHSAVRHAWSAAPDFMWAFGIERNYLSDHFSPVLLALVPLDMIFRSPLTLLVIEALVFGLGTLALIGLARSMGVSPLLAQGLGAVYATNSIAWDSGGGTPRARRSRRC